MTYLAHLSLCNSPYLNFQVLEEKLHLSTTDTTTFKPSYYALWPASLQLLACVRTRVEEVVFQQKHDQPTKLVVSDCIYSYAFLGLYWEFIFTNLFLTFSNYVIM